MAGASLADIGDLLGHKDLATTQIYAKVQQEHLRAVISKLTPLISEVGTPAPKAQLLPGTTAAVEPTKKPIAAAWSKAVSRHHKEE